MHCKICNNSTEQVFNKTVIKKYQVNYYLCNSCSFMQTDEPLWLEEAYNNAITSLDIGLVSRNIQMADDTSAIIDACFPDMKIALDYAGGYGMFVRMMRDRGYNFFRQDPFCENLFAKHFDISDINYPKFDIITAFEVFEHFKEPLVEIEKLLQFGNHIVFSTELMPDFNRPSDLANWWYIAEETGQHIAFYNLKTMNYLSNKYNKNYYSKNSKLHLFTTLNLNQEQVDYAFNNIRERSYAKGLVNKKLDFRINRTSLLQDDYNYIKKLLK